MIKTLKSLAVMVMVVTGCSLAYGDQIKLTVGSPYGKVEINKKQNVWVRVGLTGFTMESDKKRAPVNVAIVLDRSGSMQGKKIAKAKEAAIAAIGINGIAPIFPSGAPSPIARLIAASTFEITPFSRPSSAIVC